MFGIFNSHNFTVHKGADNSELSKLAKISYSHFEYGRHIQLSEEPFCKYIKLIYDSFGSPSYILADSVDGPVECWIISSPSNHEIIYIEFWKRANPKRMYIFFNVKNTITSLFLKHLYENVK